MAVYNEEGFLTEAVESVLAQSFGDFELIISDDGSTDDTPALARSLAKRDPERIRVLRSEQNQGKPSALNRALAVRRGELIAWLDGDDVMLPGKLERQVGALDSDRQAAGCAHDAEIFDSDSGDGRSGASRAWRTGARCEAAGSRCGSTRPTECCRRRR